MNGRRASGNSALDNAAATAVDRLTTTANCPACGYPTLDPGLCAYCRPTLAV